MFAVAISRWAPRLHGQVAERLAETYPGDRRGGRRRREDSGRLQPLFEGSFSGYCHRPDELRGEVLAAGLEMRRSRGRRGDRVRARRPRGAAGLTGGAGGRARRGAGTRAGSGASGPQPAPPGDGAATPDLCLAKRFAKLRGRAQDARWSLKTQQFGDRPGLYRWPRSIDVGFVRTRFGGERKPVGHPPRPPSGGSRWVRRPLRAGRGLPRPQTLLHGQRPVVEAALAVVEADFATCSRRV